LARVRSRFATFTQPIRRTKIDASLQEVEVGLDGLHPLGLDEAHADLVAGAVQEALLNPGSAVS
jgi:hypothetical protein